jgi:ABC-type transport system substrate-binding protein
VRQAINHAIDTDLIIKRLVKDKAYRAVSWLPLSSPAFDKNVKPYAFDPDKAKKLLAEAGYPDGFEFELTTSQNESWGLPIVEAIIPMLAKVGIKVKPKLVEVTVLTDIAMKGEHQAYRLQPDRPGFARHLALLLLQDAAHGLQLHRLQQPRLRQAARRRGGEPRPRQAQRSAASGQQHDL